MKRKKKTFFSFFLPRSVAVYPTFVKHVLGLSASAAIMLFKFAQLLSILETKQFLFFVSKLVTAK